MSESPIGKSESVIAMRRNQHGEESYRASTTGPQDRYPLLIQFRHVLERDREKGHGIVDVPVPGTG